MDNKKSDKTVLRISRNGLTVSLTIAEGLIQEIHLSKAGKESTGTVPDEYQPIAAQFDKYLSGRPVEWQLPLNTSVLKGFQVQVFQKLRKTGFGRTISYEALAEISATVNHRRAVAMALSRNPFPIVIPCHRVVPKHFTNDSIGGFSEGIDIKRKLLILENPFLFRKQ
jgi:methylated-DNA-[protein]-cysteine S-methyltransferase